ncbi:MAG: hypothetical protein IPH96_13125 [Saprospiraceae bacterium]|nr:hypothetical protein [Saprospiraceae bacterium]
MSARNVKVQKCGDMVIRTTMLYLLMDVMVSDYEFMTQLMVKLSIVQKQIMYQMGATTEEHNYLYHLLQPIYLYWEKLFTGCSTGCTATSQSTVNVSQTMTANAGLDKTMCLGVGTSLTANVVGGTPNYTYLWVAGNFTTQTINVNPTCKYNLQSCP